MKRPLLLLVALGALAAPGRLAAQSIPVGPAGQISSVVNLPIVIPVVADLSARSEKLGAFALRLAWNPAVLQITGGSDGSFGGISVNDDSLQFGVARIAGVSPAGASGVVTLVNVQLTPLVKDTATLSFAVTEFFAAGTFADLLPSVVASNGHYCPARGRWGDIDGDGNANSRDALIALSNAVGLDVSAFDVGLGDVDGLNGTNARDALIILSNAVGVDVGGFRVLRIAGGACSSNAAVALSITPAPVTLVKGQSVRFEAWAADSGTGAPASVADASWKSSAPFVLLVGQDGEAYARDTGTVVVTALRGTRDSAQATVHIVARRTTHWVDAVAANANNRLGTPELPFGSIEEGLQFAQDGDTVRVRLGRYQPSDGYLYLDRPVVLIGDTAADGSRPLVVGAGSREGDDALSLGGFGRRDVQNLAFQGFGDVAYVYGPDQVLLRGIRATDVEAGVYIDAPVHSVRIEQSSILGPETPVSDAPAMRGGSPSAAYLGYGQAGVEVDQPVDTLTIEDTEIGGFAYGVVFQVFPDSTAVLRSNLHDFGYAAIANQYGSICEYECAPPATRAPSRSRRAAAAAARPVARAAQDGPVAPALVVQSSRLSRTQYDWLVNLDAAFRQVAFAHNVFTNGRDILRVYGEGVPGSAGFLSLLGDSIIGPPDPYNTWIDAEYLDSLVIDSLRAAHVQYGYAYDVPLIRMTNSTIRDLRCNGECTAYGLQVRFGYSVGEAGGVFQLDNDSLIGDPRDDASATGFDLQGARVEANRLTAVNLYAGIRSEASDSSVTVTNSLFQHIVYPIYWDPSSYPAPVGSFLTVRGSTFRGFAYAVQAYDAPMVVDSNVFDGGQQAIDLRTPLSVTVTRNQIGATAGALDVESYDRSATVTVTDNVATGISGLGLYVSGSTYPDTLHTLFDVRRNTVTCSGGGAGGIAGIELYEAHLLVLDNQVSNCFEGIRTIVSTYGQRSDSIVGNTVTAPPSAHFGIGVAGNIDVRIGRNTVTGAPTGGQTAALIDVDSPCGWWACPDNGSTVAMIDSNVVSGGTRWGIRVQDTDSLQILGNTVQNLNSATSGYTGYTQDVGGITLMGYFGRFASVVGNLVRHIVGSGIIVTHGDGNVVLVDSNIVADLDTTGLSGYGGGGIYLPWGPALITRNLLTGARRNGVWIATGDSVGLTGNNIAGNSPYGVTVDYDRGWVDAYDNWWGDPLGPRGVGDPDSSLAGDSVNGVNWDPFRIVANDSAPTSVPAGAARFLARALPPPHLRPVARLASAREGGFPATDRLPALRAAPQLRAPAARGQATARQTERTQSRTQVEAQRLQRLQSVRARLEARDRALQAARAARAAPPRAARGQGVRP